MNSLVDTFVQVANKNPQKIAVISTGQQINYKNLLNLVEIINCWLHEAGLQKGDRVGIHLQNSIEYIAVYYACWRGGCIPVALNTLASQREVEFWLSDSECKLVFSQKLKLPESKVRSVSIYYDNEGLKIDDSVQSLVSSFFSHVTLLEDVATIIYTSGTTGNPKGITLLHRNISTNIHAIIKSLNITSRDRFLCVLPFFYSFGNSILHTHLVAGATLVLLNKVMYPVEILKTIEREKCNGFAGVPSLYISLLKKTRFDLYDLSSLRYLTQAGGPLPSEFIEKIHNSLDDVSFVVMYGQTEASARISYLPPVFLNEKLGSVGIGVDGLTIFVLNEDGFECASGEKGEICVSGQSIMSGYWNNPIATEKVLHDGMLHTGDMGYKDADGFLYIVGRQTEILKISEHRVSPYEIEEAIIQMEEIDECAIIGCSHEQMGQVAKAFVILNSDTTVNQIKVHCKERLAIYKIPKEIVFVDSLPKTTSGKIKRSELSC